VRFLCLFSARVCGRQVNETNEDKELKSARKLNNRPKVFLGLAVYSLANVLVLRQILLHGKDIHQLSALYRTADRDYASTKSIVALRKVLLSERIHM
jgi:hypothetical protein